MCRIVFTLLLNLLVCTVFAQTADLKTQQQGLSGMIGKVENAKSTFTQDWSYESEVPYRVKLTVTETDKKKGKSQTTEYAFNLADLDENLVREETRRDLKYITAGVGGKQNMIEIFEDGEQQNYDDEISILVSDSKAADELRDKLRTIIPVAKEMDRQRLNINGYGEMVTWLETNISDFTSAGDTYQSSLRSQTGDELIYDYILTKKDSKGSSTTVYTFNLADLDPYSVKLDVRGKSIGVQAGTERDQRFVTIMEDGEMKNYDDEIDFMLGDIDSARDLAEVLRLVIPEAIEKRTQMLVPTEDLTAGLEAFGQALTDFEQEDEKFKHQYEANCYTTYRLQETDGKGSTTENSYEFHLGDLADNNVSIKVSGKDIYVVGAIKNGDDYIKNFRDGEQRNYTDEVDFRANGVENAKSLAFLLRQVAKGCAEQQEKTLAMTQKGALSDWIVQQVDAFKDANEPEYEQHLTVNEAECSLVFSTISPKGKGVEKMRYEVFLKELNQEALRPDVSGKTMSVELTTTYNEDHIKSYKDDEVEKYTNSFEIRVPGITEARRLIVGLKQLLEGCK